MNCIDKMYKEIEEILRKEKLEFEKLAMPVREIRHGFSQDAAFLTEEEVFEPVDYLAEISLSDEWVKKYLAEEKAKDFIRFIFKKYLCFNLLKSGEQEFFKSLEQFLEEGNLLESLKKAENEFIQLLGGETEEIKAFFINPYNALFKDENGYFAVIKNGKFSDVKRPFGFNPNQMKKIIKENFDEYVNDFASQFSSEKEKNAFLNNLKAEVNKSTLAPLELEALCTEKLNEALIKNGVSQNAITSYLEEKGLSLIKQGNYYFRKKAHNEYAEYKKIEFRY